MTPEGSIALCVPTSRDDHDWRRRMMSNGTTVYPGRPIGAMFLVIISRFVPSYLLVQSRNARATMFAARDLYCMTRLTLQLAATHDHWFEEPAAQHALPAFKLFWKHFSKQHPIVVDSIEWTGCGAIGLMVLLGSLVANA
jgi:hypothetical protein